MGNINWSEEEENAGGVFKNEFIGQDGNLNKQQQVRENADSISGVMQPNIGTYVGGYVGQIQQEQKERIQQATGTYVGGFIGNEQLQSVGEVQNGIQQINPKALPVKQTIWSKIKAFLCQEVELPSFSLEISEKEQKVLTEVHDFLFQEISFKGFMDILKIGTNRK